MRRGPIPYSAEEMVWLEANFKLVISDYHRAFVAAFGRDDVSLCHLNQLRKRKGWKVGRDGGRYIGRRRRFSDAEITWLRNHCSMPISEYHPAFCKEFGREDVSAANLHGLRKREGWKTGRTGHFVKGAEPLNKGKKCAPGTGGLHPNAQRTQFRPGRLPHNHQGAGHERIDSKDGYAIIIVDEVNPWTGAATRPMHKHRWLWEQANGPIPDGFVLKCIGEDKTNCDPSNWELIPREVLPRLNGRFGMHYDQAAPEIKPTIMAVAKLKHAVTQVRRRKSA
ncbi:HNH endonuclease signature motif containing protein [Pararhizobium sp. DWP3-4]|uniref:HNH endonuclease signature motif containing protein n=1 Tax=Pararhizobium sp. DWP3-4 TaxID=2804565 RepID=UPI003CEE0532